MNSLLRFSLSIIAIGVSSAAVIAGFTTSGQVMNIVTESGSVTNYLTFADGVRSVFVSTFTSIGALFRYGLFIIPAWFVAKKLRSRRLWNIPSALVAGIVTGTVLTSPFLLLLLFFANTQFHIFLTDGPFLGGIATLVWFLARTEEPNKTVETT